MSLPDHFEVTQTAPNRIFARDIRTGRDVVIKELTLGRISEWKELDLFEREVSTLRQLSHPAIPAFLEEIRSAEGEPRFYLVCERAPGAPLTETADEFDEGRLIVVARAVLEVLEYLQSFSPPIIHRNITPEAVFVTDDHDVQLIDFGAVQVELHATVGGSTVVGTSGYMAPEQLLGRATPASDLYALGATLVFVLTGLEPSDLPDERMRLLWREHARFGTDTVHDWVDRLIEPDPRHRFASATDALRALGGQLAKVMPTGRPRDTRADFTRSTRRLELKVSRPLVRWRHRWLLIGALSSTAKAVVDLSAGAALVTAAFVATWVALTIKDYLVSSDSSLLLDVDRGYRLRGPDGVFVAGPLEDVVSVEAGFRGERDALWLTTGDEPRRIATGLSKAEREWLSHELQTFLDDHHR